MRAAQEFQRRRMAPDSSHLPCSITSTARGDPVSYSRETTTFTLTGRTSAQAMEIIGTPTAGSYHSALAIGYRTQRSTQTSLRYRTGNPKEANGTVTSSWSRRTRLARTTERLLFGLTAG